MSEITRTNFELDKGPIGPLFYLIEKSNPNIELAYYLSEISDSPKVNIYKYPHGEDHSEILIHEACIKFAKNGQKEILVEEDQEMFNRYVLASTVLRKGGIIMQITESGIEDIDQSFVKELDILFPQLVK